MSLRDIRIANRINEQPMPSKKVTHFIFSKDEVNDLIKIQSKVEEKHCFRRVTTAILIKTAVVKLKFTEELLKSHFFVYEYDERMMKEKVIISVESEIQRMRGKYLSYALLPERNIRSP